MSKSQYMNKINNSQGNMALPDYSAILWQWNPYIPKQMK